MTPADGGAAVSLYREIDALGGAGEGERHKGYSQALTDVLAILERRGFTEAANAGVSATTFMGLPLNDALSGMYHPGDDA